MKYMVIVSNCMGYVKVAGKQTAVYNYVRVPFLELLTFFFIKNSIFYRAIRIGGNET